MWCDSSGKVIPKAESFGLMGIVNLTPDSFYVPSRKPDIKKALAHVKLLLDSGADIIDLGAESTRPGAKPVDWEIECNRLIPVLKEIRTMYPDIPISVDTRNARTAMASLEAGASIINDVSALQYDPELLYVIGEFKPAYILVHSKGTPQTMQINPTYSNLIQEIKDFFFKSIEKLEKVGLPFKNIILDPGIGFGKLAHHNLQIIQNISDFLSLKRPLIAGISMKSFINKIWSFSEEEKVQAVEIISAFLFLHGCQWHRVHNVKKVKNALLIAQKLH